MILRLLVTLVFGAAIAADYHYPAARRSDVTDSYHGVQVADPYRWLENPDSAESRKWIAEENALTQSYLSSVTNLSSIKAELTKLSSTVLYPTDPEGFVTRGHRHFFLRRDAGKNQPILYWMEGLNRNPKALLDPNSLSREGTAALDSWSVSWDGKTISYGIARAGSDWQDIFFRSVDTGQDLGDKLEWSKFSFPQWTKDDRAVYYTHFPQPPEKELLTAASLNSKLYLHRIGTFQKQDSLIYARPDHENWDFAPYLSEDGNYLFIEVFEGTRPENLLYYQDLRTADRKIVPVIEQFEAQYLVIGNQGPKVFLSTTKDASRSRVITLDLAKKNEIAEIVPQSDAVLDGATLRNNLLYLSYEKNVTSQLVVCSPEGKDKHQVALPGKGTGSWASLGAPFFWFSGFAEPSTLYSADLQTLELKPFGPSLLPFDPGDFETRQVFYASKDGTQIPMFLIGKKGFQAHPSTPCLLYGYGGFSVAVDPFYSPLFLEWIQLGGMVAVANLRGGNEYGEEWHHAGMKANKQNVFNDFISAAEWLIANQYTSTPKLGIYGRSNGGLLIGAVLNQRPDLFGAAVPAVGVMDMLRFHRFTVGEGWTSDYGSPDNETDFKILRAYSPLHNVRQDGHYPPTLALTADHDDRVVPGHSFKYTAEMQHAQKGPSPILIRIETSAGHGGGKPVSKQVDESAAIIAFLEKALGMPQ